jgi:hypothetical protein
MYYSTFMPSARLLFIDTRNSIVIDGLAFDGTWNSKFDYPQVLLHNPIYRSLKALGPEVDDFLSEIFQRRTSPCPLLPTNTSPCFHFLTK